MKNFLLTFVCLVAVLGYLFHQGLSPGMILFSNDLPLGMHLAKWSWPEAGLHTWLDTNLLGLNTGDMPLSLSTMLRVFSGPIACLIGLGTILACGYLLFPGLISEQTLKGLKRAKICGGLVMMLLGAILTPMFLVMALLSVLQDLHVLK